MSPEAFGPWRVQGLLGSGATARVWRAVHEADGRTAAVKVLEVPDDGTGAAARRFRREAELARRLSHPGIPAVWDAGLDERRPWVAFELVEGRTLERRLEDGPLEWTEAARVFIELADSLARLHRAGIVHRDVKPANVVLEETGRVRLIDLGLATDAGGEQSVEGRFAGTPRYMAPEQVTGGPVLPATDLYALGVSFHEAVSGDGPFDAGNEAALVAAHLHARPRPLSSGAAVPAALDAVVGACLAKRPELRYADAADLVADLRLVLERPEVEPARTAAGRRLGLRGLRGSLPGRSDELRRIRSWLAAGARGRSVPALLIRGAPGTGRTALLEAAAAEAQELGLAVGADGEGPRVQLVDDAAVLPDAPAGSLLLAAGLPTLAPGERRVRLVDLEPLGPGALRRWAREETGLSRIDSRDLDFLHRWSGGKPARAEPLLFRWRRALARGEAPPAGELERLLDSDSSERERLAGRLDALSAEARLLVELLAVLYPVPAAVEALAGALGCDAEEIETALGACLRLGVEVDLAAGACRLRELVVPGLVRELTDAAVAPDLRDAALELLAGDASGAGLRRRAELLRDAGETGRANEAAVEAARRLNDEAHADEAARVVEQWLERVDWSGVDDAGELLRRAVRWLGDAGEPARAAALLESAAGRVGDRARLALSFERAAEHWRHGRLAEARSGFLATSARARRLDEPRRRFECATGLASIDWAEGRAARATRLLATLEDLAGRVPARTRVDWLQLRGALALLTGDDALAERCLERAVSEARAAEAEDAIVGLAEERSVLFLRTGRLEQARSVLEEALELARRRGNEQRRAYLTHLLGSLQLQAGEAARAERTLRSAKRAAHRTGHLQLVACNEELLVRTAAASGRLDEARRLVALTRRHDPGSPNVEAYLCLSEADLALLEGDRPTARERLAAARRLEDSLDDEGRLFLEAVELLLSAAEGRPVPSGRRDRLAQALERSSFAFRVPEWAERLGGA